MAFKMNQISCDLASYPYYMLLSPRKFGKTNAGPVYRRGILKPAKRL